MPPPGCLAGWLFGPPPRLTCAASVFPTREDDSVAQELIDLTAEIGANKVQKGSLGQML